MNTLTPVAQFDSTDAAYILEAFLTIYRAHTDHQVVQIVADENGGQVGLYSIMWDTATACATACMALDFSAMNVGVFAYDVLADVNELSLSNVFFWRCAIGGQSPDEVLAAYALLKDWPLQGAEAKPESGEVVRGTATGRAVGVTSIQLQTTIDSGDDIEVCDASSPSATHWSVYYRYSDGTANHSQDFLIGESDAAKQYAEGLARKWGVSVEPVRG